MDHTPIMKRYRTNPVELVIFLAITGIFAHSVYRLFYESPHFNPSALKPMAANPLSEGRAPASTSQSFLNLEVRCDSNTSQETTANKVRLNGSLCGAGDAERSAPQDSSKDSGNGPHLVKTSVINAANRFNATVFTDTSSDKFSTDYIPLSPGNNPIHVEFSYRGGKTVAQQIVIQKN